MMTLIPDKYNKEYKGHKIDPYRIAKMYGIEHPCQFHVIKKLLRAGWSEKTTLQEIEDCIATLYRWKEMMIEDFEFKSDTVSQWEAKHPHHLGETELVYE